MSKPIPQIQITSADKSENKKSKRWEEENASSEVDSSDGEVWEILSNLASPGRTRCAVYSLAGGSGTGSDALSMSEDEQLVDRLTFSLSSATNENTNIKECYLTKKLYSPSRTPERMSGENPSSLFTNFHTLEIHTDNELLYSDQEIKTRKTYQKEKTLDGFVSDLEDSDSSLSDNPFQKPRKNSLHIENDYWSPSYHERKRSEPILSGFHPSNDLSLYFPNTNQIKAKSSIGQKKKNDMAAFKFTKIKTKHGKKNTLDLQKKEHFPMLLDDLGSYTDLEEVDCEEMEEDTDKKVVAYIPESKREIVIANENMKGDVALILPINKPSNIKLAIKMEGFDCGFSDVEDLPDYIDEDAQGCPTPEPPLTEASYVKSSETIKEKSKLQILIDRHEPGTDTEEINVKHEGKYRKSKAKDVSSLFVEKFINDPLTDTEEILIHSKNESCIVKPKKLTLGLEKNQREPLTDCEEIMIEENYQSKLKLKHVSLEERGQINGNSACLEDLLVLGTENSSRNIDQTLTDIEEFSDDDGLAGERKKAKRYREFQVISASNVTTLRESHKPFSEEAKAKLRSSKSEIVMRNEVSSPCGPTEQEDFSGEEEVLTSPLSEPPLEPHISTVHIQNSRTFKPDTNELKVNLPPDPLTDTEDLDINIDKRN